MQVNEKLKCQLSPQNIGKEPACVLPKKKTSGFQSKSFQWVFLFPLQLYRSLDFQLFPRNHASRGASLFCFAFSLMTMMTMSIEVFDVSANLLCTQHAAITSWPTKA